MEKADKMIIRAFIADQMAQCVAASTIRHRLNSLGNFFGYLIFEGLRQDNPIPEVRKRYLTSYKAESETHTCKLISVADAAKLINSCMDIRDKAMILLLLKTGVRRGELLSMEVSDINFDNQSIVLKPKKKRSNRIVFLTVKRNIY